MLTRNVNMYLKQNDGWLTLLFWCISSNFLQSSQVTNRPTNIFHLIWRSKMPEISKCPKHTKLLAHWEALREVSVRSQKNLVFDSSRWSYCSSSTLNTGDTVALMMLHRFRATVVTLWRWAKWKLKKMGQVFGGAASGRSSQMGQKCIWEPSTTAGCICNG